MLRRGTRHTPPSSTPRPVRAMPRRPRSPPWFPEGQLEAHSRAGRSAGSRPPRSPSRPRPRRPDPARAGAAAEPRSPRAAGRAAARTTRRLVPGLARSRSQRWLRIECSAPRRPDKPLSGHTANGRRCWATGRSPFFVKVCVPKEVKPGERRVALVPDVAGKLVQAGFEVIVQSGAGAEAHLPDADYEEKGATIVASPAELLGQADVVVKVAAPVIGDSPGGDE